MSFLTLGVGGTGGAVSQTTERMINAMPFPVMIDSKKLNQTTVNGVVSVNR